MSDIRARSVITLATQAVTQTLLVLTGAALLSGVIFEPGARPVAMEAPAPAVTGMPVGLPVPPPPPVQQASQFSAEPLTPRMQAALDYASRRYRVSADALVPVFSATQKAARELSLDPLLVIAVIGIESNFNPFSESVAGAQGLMQVIPRFHKEKLPGDGGKLHLFDPATNVRVGTLALHEYIRRNGDIVSGLQQFAGDSRDPGRNYAARVLAEKERLEIAGRRRSPVGVPEFR